MLLPRPTDVEKVRWLMESNPVVALLGARQVGKTTLARFISDEQTHWFDLEDSRALARLDDPLLALEPLRGVVVIDEIQLRSEIFPSLRVLADRPGTPARFLILGSASPDLLRQGSQSLAGRMAFHELGPLALDEVGVEQLDTLWLRGGFPRSFLAKSDARSMSWRKNFIRTFVERDVPRLGFILPARTLERFWTMVAHNHGQLLNSSALGRSLGVAHTTVRRYADLLSGAFLLRQLRPWHANVAKRQIKTSKIFIMDTGLLHGLLGLDSLDDLLSHPICGPSWEGFAMRQVVRRLGAGERECYFWATRGGAELDLLVVRGNRRIGFEFKRTAAPRRTKSMAIALETLQLDSLHVIYPGRESWPMTQRLWATGLSKIWADLAPL